MDSSTLIPGIAGGIAAMITMMVLQGRSKKLTPQIEEKLKARPEGMTLPELSTSMGMGNFYARGKVVMALNELVQQKRIETIPAPDGTPQLKKVDFIRYKLNAPKPPS